MKLRFAVLSLISASAMVVFVAPPVLARAAEPVAGTFVRRDIQVTHVTPLGAATLLQVVEHGDIVGAFNGTYEGTDTCLEFSTGVAECTSRIHIAGSIGGVPGSLDLFDVGTFRADLSNPPAGSLDSRFVVVGGTGGGSGVHGAGTLSATLAADGSYTGTYSGVLTLRG